MKRSRIQFRFYSFLFCLVCTCFAHVGADAASRPQKKQTPLWAKIPESSVAHRDSRSVTPEKYLVFRLNESMLKNLLTRLPLEFTDEARGRPVVMEIPMPDGSLYRFKMVETRVLAPHLSAQFPSWKTFIGHGVDDPAITGRFDWNALGFHGYVSTNKGTVVIDPYAKGDTSNYLVFHKHEFGRSYTDFYCRTEKQLKQFIDTNPDYDFAPQFSYGAAVRTYNLAVATTGEWARNASGYTGTQTPTQIRTGALAVLQTTVNRLIGIYERELASRFQLVNPDINNNATNIIFDNPATDPYDNTDNTAQLTINQTTLDARVGTANYDIGHLYGTGGGGVAATPSLCSATAKAEGYSARGTNTGDPFVVDYVAHEIGHQFGAGHTYNNADPPGTTCTTRAANDAFEVASGATIMSYVGICAERNLQQFVDTGFPSFHIRSLTTIVTNLTTGDPQTTGCGTGLGANNVPTVNAGNSFTIPRLTPFTLTATGNDADPGDVANLLYSWEEFDLAPSASGVLGTPAGTYDVDTDGILRPLFRPYSPVAANQRTYPSLTFILNPANNDAAADIGGVRGNQPVLTYMGTHPTNAPGAICEPSVTCVIGERLPTANRTMNFRVSLRDRRGGIVDAGTSVTVAAGTGPFQVTAQNSFSELAPAVTWQAGTMQTVTWDVANTNAAPINAANVNILLSTNGGQTFPITLVAGTPNDGTQQITVPNNSTTQARIKVEGAGNVFFDINNVNFQITPPTAASVSVSGRVMTADGRGIRNAIVTMTDANGVAWRAVTSSFGYYRFDDVRVGETYAITVTSKRYQFTPRVIIVADELNDVDFVAN